MQLPTVMAGHAGDPLPPGAAAMVAAPNIIEENQFFNVTLHYTRKEVLT